MGGLPDVKKQKKNPYSHYNKLKRMQNKLNTGHEYMKSMLETFHYMDRCIFILLYKQHRVKYQYDIKERYLLLRIETDINGFGGLVDKLFSCSVKYNDLRSVGGSRVIPSIYQRGNVYQLMIRIYDSSDHYLTYSRWLSTYELFLKLPPRSSICTENLPILNAFDVCS